jgi:ribosome-binding factor A
LSRRTEQAASTLRKALQQVLAKGLSDPRAHGLITITGVRVTEDLQEALINVSVLPAERQDLVLHALKDASNYIRREVGEIVDARKLPKFTFRLDTSLKREATVLDALNKVAREREAKGLPSGADSPADAANDQDARHPDDPAPGN